jgi:hypothetical protein
MSQPHVIDLILRVRPYTTLITLYLNTIYSTLNVSHMTAVYYKIHSASHFNFNIFTLLQKQYFKPHQVFYAPTLLTFPSRPKYDPLHHSCRRAAPYSKTGIPVSPSNHNPSLWHQFYGVKYRSQYCCYPYATFWVSRSCTTSNRLTIP